MKTHGWKLDPVKRAYYEAQAEKRANLRVLRRQEEVRRLEAEWRLEFDRQFWARHNLKIEAEKTERKRSIWDSIWPAQ